MRAGISFSTGLNQMASHNSEGVRVIRSGTGNTLVDIAGEKDPGRTVAVQADGKVWLGGFTHNVGEQYGYAVARLNADGTLDTRFGDGGKQVIADQVMLGDEYSMAVQSDGRLLVTHGHWTGTNVELIVSRYTTSGKLDTSFGGNGVVTIASDISYADTGTTVLADGTVLVSGSKDGVYTVARLTADGSLDTTFNGTGILTLSGPSEDAGYFHYPLALQADGKLLFPGVAGDKFGLYRYNADGGLDTSFGDSGHVSYSVGAGPDAAYTVTVQPDGKLLLAGTSQAANFDASFGIVRLNPDGSLDTSFSGDGKAIFPVGLDDRPYSLAVQSDGKILAGGATDGNFSVVRLNVDGTLDRSFGTLINGFEVISGTAGDDVILGGDVRENISSYGGNDLIDGGAGREAITTGAGADVIRYTALSDSYRSGNQAFSDFILDFDASQDRIDLSTLDFTGFGNGYEGTLAVVQNTASERSYLRSYDADAQGNRFEISFNGLYQGVFNTSNVLFSAVAISGTAEADTLRGTAATEILTGLAGNDRLDGGTGDDTLLGGAGRDVLTGARGDDVFSFTSLTDSYRTATTGHSDSITDFTHDEDRGQDRIDVSALGFAALGDGHNGTLAVQVSADASRTYIKNFDADDQGQRFEVTLNGDHSDLTATDFIFQTPVELLGSAGVDMA
jgi:uncharacterized delta-60 repeat protein